MSNVINWKVTKQDVRDIKAIAERAVLIVIGQDPDFAETHKKAELVQDFTMDITACHANGCRLQLGRLRHADNVNFAHDVFGIRRFINRATGKIPAERFWPRFAGANQ